MLDAIGDLECGVFTGTSEELAIGLIEKLRECARFENKLIYESSLKMSEGMLDIKGGESGGGSTVDICDVLVDAAQDIHNRLDDRSAHVLYHMAKVLTRDISSNYGNIATEYNSGHSDRLESIELLDEVISSAKKEWFTARIKAAGWGVNDALEYWGRGYEWYTNNCNGDIFAKRRLVALIKGLDFD